MKESRWAFGLMAGLEELRLFGKGEEGEAARGGED